RIEQAALLVLESLKLAQRVQRARRRVRRLETARDRAVVADLDAALLEEGLSRAVRHGGPGERKLQVDRILGQGLIELVERRQARLAGRRHEMVRIEAADRRDPLAGRQRR